MLRVFLQKYAVLFIFILALLFRFWNLENVPPSMYWDEVSQGYNSYSILKTGYDEHHEFLPLAKFNAFGDYKAPVYIYLDVPFIALFGKSTLAVRFPSALLGSLTVLLTYFLAKELFFDNKHKKYIGLFASLLLAISPWHIQLSRVAYEANAATFFTVLGVYVFLYSIRKKSHFLILSIISFVLAFYAFNAHRVFVPLFLLFLFGVNYKYFLKNKKVLIFSALVGIIMLLPFVFYLQTPESKLRFNEVNIFTDLGVVKKSNQWIAEDNNSFVSKVVHNRRVLFSLLYVKHYFDFFNPNYLFFQGDGNPRFSLQDTGELYLWELPLLLFGFYALFKSQTKSALILLGWFLLAPIAGATARETPHALRSETFIPTYQLIVAVGAIQLGSLMKNLSKSLKYGAALIGGIYIVFAVYIFLHDYFVHYQTTFSYEWQYGYKQAVLETEKLKDNYDTIAFTESYGRAYIYVLFYGDTNPSSYWDNSKVIRDAFGFYNVDRVGKYEFRKDLLSPSDKGKKVLYVGQENEIPEGAKTLNTIYFLDGGKAFVIAGSN